MQKRSVSKKWSLLVLLPLMGLPLYQNCGSVNLLRANNVSSKAEEIPPSPSCPAVLPDFQCENWEPWSDVANSCGTRNRSCQRELPADCQEETSQVQTESAACSEPDSGTYTTQTEHTDTCGGSYKFESFPDPTGDTRVKVFKLRDNTTGRYILPDAWSSETALVLRYSDGSAKIQMRTPSCELQTIEVRFKDKCGASVTLGHIYTMDGCPAPNPNIETGAEDVILPTDSNGSNLRAQSIEIGFNSQYYLKPQFRKIRNVESLVNAIYGLYDGASDPSVIQRDWFTASGPYWFRIPNGKYISMRFTTPNTTERLVLNVGTWEQPIEGGGPVSVSISEFPGDFYIGRADKGCMIGNLGYGTVQGLINLKHRPDLKNRCHLNPGQKYYINVTGTTIPWVGEFTGGNQHTTWFTQFNMYYSDPPHGRIYDP